jgi:hypothetical protein
MTTMLSAALLVLSARAEGWCIEGARVTGYVRTEHGSHTYDGTSILSDEPIVAASWDIPLGWYADVEGLGRYRVADRGSGLGSAGWIDIAVWSRAEAFALTSVRRVCVVPPGGHDEPS